MHGHQKMNHIHFDSLAFYPLPASVQNITLSDTVVYDLLVQVLAEVMMFPSASAVFSTNEQILAC